jgi:sugar phosphate isomerase/epimerase
MTWKLSDTDWNHWPEKWTDKDCFENAKVEDLYGIELGVYHSDEQLSEKRLGEIGKLTELTGVKISGLLLSLLPELWPQGALTGESTRLAGEVEKVAQIAKSLGIDVVGLWPGADLDESDTEALHQGLELVSQAATPYGIRIALEYKPDTVIPDAASTLTAVRPFENIGVLVDSGHAYALGEDPTEVISRVAAAGKLFHVHLGDADTGGADDDLPVGRLHSPDEYLQELGHVGFAGVASFDLYGAVEGAGISSKDAVSESVAAVRAAGVGFPA